MNPAMTVNPWLFPRSRAQPRDRADAARLLDRRFAAGEIDEDAHRQAGGQLTFTH